MAKKVYYIEKFNGELLKRPNGYVKYFYNRKIAQRIANKINGKVIQNKKDVQYSYIWKTRG